MADVDGIGEGHEAPAPRRELGLQHFQRELLAASRAALPPPTRVVRDLDGQPQHEQEQLLLDLASDVKAEGIVSLSLVGNLLPDAAVQLLAGSFKDSVLEAVDLTWNRVTDLGAGALAAGLQGSKVWHLSLVCNRVSDSGAASLAAGLSGSRLRSLNLGGNFVGDEGTAALAQGLSASTLEDLNLSQNDVGDQGACALATCLPTSSLQRLALAGNWIGTPGLSQLGSVLRASPLTCLDLSDNVVGANAQALIDGLRDSAVVELRAQGLGLSTAALLEIEERLQENKERCLVLQMEATGDEANLKLTFRTMGGSVAAVLTEAGEHSPEALQAAVWAARRQTLPTSGVSASSLRFVLPSGQMLATGPGAASLAQQLGMLPAPLVAQEECAGP